MRTFIAVDVQTDTIARLQNEIMMAAGWNPSDVKPVAPNNFHFTLIFLGEKSESDIDNIKGNLAQVQFEPFKLTYTGVGGFPNLASARVVWVGVDRVGSEKLTALAKDVVRRMSELGFSEDKSFSPHLTIFRAKGRPVQVSNISAKYQGRMFDSELIDKVHLKRSDLAPLGPIYSNIYTVEAKK